MTAVRSALPCPFTTADLDDTWSGRTVMFFYRGLLRSGVVAHVRPRKDDAPVVMIDCEVSVTCLAEAALSPEPDALTGAVPATERITLDEPGVIVLRCRVDDIPEGSVGRRIALEADHAGNSAIGRLCAVVGSDDSDILHLDIDTGNGRDSISSVRCVPTRKAYLY